MRDNATAVRAAIVSKLRDQVLLESATVPVYAKVVPRNVGPAYVYIPTQFGVNVSNKNFFREDQTVRVEAVYTSFDGLDSYVIDDLADQVKKLLIKHNMSELPAFDGRVDFEYEGDQDLLDIDGTNYIFRRVMTFKAYVDEG